MYYIFLWVNYINQLSCLRKADLNRDLEAILLVSLLRLFHISIALTLKARAKNIFFLNLGFFNNSLSFLHFVENLVLDTLYNVHLLYTNLKK